MRVDAANEDDDDDDGGSGLFLFFISRVDTRRSKL